MTSALSAALSHASNAFFTKYPHAPQSSQHQQRTPNVPTTYAECLRAEQKIKHRTSSMHVANILDDQMCHPNVVNLFYKFSGG